MSDSLHNHITFFATLLICVQIDMVSGLYTQSNSIISPYKYAHCLQVYCIDWPLQSVQSETTFCHGINIRATTSIDYRVVDKLQCVIFCLDNINNY